MKKTLLALVFLTILTSLNAQESKNYGGEISLTEKTKISDIMASPENYESKKVLVEGTVVNVCQTRGCWIELASDKEYETIVVKVNDGEIVFPMESKGKTALVEGEVFSFIPAVEQEHKHSDHAEHKEVKEEGKDSDCQSSGCCSESKEAKKLYRIKGMAAVIK